MLSRLGDWEVGGEAAQRRSAAAAPAAPPPRALHSDQPALPTRLCGAPEDHQLVQAAGAASLCSTHYDLAFPDDLQPAAPIHTHSSFKISVSPCSSRVTDKSIRLYHPDATSSLCKIAHVEVIPARAAKFGKPEHPLPESVTATLERKGIRNLFCHQAEALNAVAAGALGAPAAFMPLLTSTPCAAMASALPWYLQGVSIGFELPHAVWEWSYSSSVCMLHLFMAIDTS